MFIDGRASKVVGPDPAVQNRESGIHLTVLRCIFFRNFASWFTGALGVWDVWPLAGTVSEVDFIHGDSLCLPNEGIFWDAQAGPELRTGVAELTLTDIHHDGGWTSAGIFSLAVPSWLFYVIGSGLSEPDAAWNVAWIRGTWIDHASWISPTLVGAVYPPVPDTQLFMNGSFVDSSIEGSVNVPGSGGGYQEGNFLHFEGTCST